MKRAIACFFFLFLFLGFPSLVHAEQIRDFTATMTIASDSSMLVSERILYDFGDVSRHGIFRDIPYGKTNEQKEKFTMELSQFSVTDEKGIPYKFSLSDTNDMKHLKIGDANTLVSGGHIYVISYKVQGALTAFSDHDELYWNIVGDQWTVPVAKASASVVFSFQESPDNIRLSCFTGATGSTDQGCTTSWKKDTAVVTSTSELFSGSGLTAVIGFPKGFVQVVEAKKVDTRGSDILAIVLMTMVVIVSLGWYVCLPIWIVVHWFRHGRDPKGTVGIAHVWFGVPKTKKGYALTPAETGTLVDETADMRDVTATILDLARRGYLRIQEEKENDFSLYRLHPKNKETLEPFEHTLYEGLFSSGDILQIKGSDLISTVTDTKNKLYDAVVAHGFFRKSPEKTRNIYYLIAGAGLMTLNLPVALIAFLFGRAMPVKTIDGVNAKNVALALKGFIVSQERQYAYQAKKQLFFEKFLPYAVVFGVEKIWAERFKDMGITSPSWFTSYDNRTFSSIILVSAINSSFTRGITTAATPTKSSSGFSSGFGGGGFSGGGGGGGGGGSW